MLFNQYFKIFQSLKKIIPFVPFVPVNYQIIKNV